MIDLTRDQIRRLRELAVEPTLPLESDRRLLTAIADEAEHPLYRCVDCGFVHRNGECSVATNDEDYG